MPTSTLLFSWIGQADLKGASAQVSRPGPLHAAALAHDYAHIVLLDDYDNEDSRHFALWLGEQIRAAGKGTTLTRRPVQLGDDKAHIGRLYDAMADAVEDAVKDAKQTGAGEAPPSLHFHLSSGMPQMAQTWTLLAQLRYPGAQLVESSRENGVARRDIQSLYTPRMRHDLENTGIALFRLLMEADTGGASRETMDIAHRYANGRGKQLGPLLTGETGTGKTHLARAIHRTHWEIKDTGAGSPPFVEVNCSAIPDTLFESAFFGHVKGAFTGATKDHDGYFHQARGGTLFLDEVGELSLLAQAKLLKALEDKRCTPVGGRSEVTFDDTLILYATNRNLLHAMNAGTFRSDLYYRISTIQWALPPLRECSATERLEIARVLAQGIQDKTDTKIPEAVLERLAAHPYSWPGNIREMDTLLKQAQFLRANERDGQPLAWEDIVKHLQRRQPDAGDTPARTTLAEAEAELRRRMIQRARQTHGDNKSAIAATLDITRATLDRYLEDLELDLAPRRRKRPA